MALDLEQAVACVTVSAPPLAIVSVVVDAADVSVACVEQHVGVHVEESIVEVRAGGPMGPPGAVSGETLVRPCAETVHGHRAVMIVDGAFRHPDVMQPAHAGAVIAIAEQSGAIGAEVSARTRGLLHEPSWTWSPGLIWCGPGGVLTQVPGPSGWLLSVGRAVDATTIDVDLDTPFMRAG